MIGFPDAAFFVPLPCCHLLFLPSLGWLEYTESELVSKWVQTCISFSSSMRRFIFRVLLSLLALSVVRAENVSGVALVRSTFIGGAPFSPQNSGGRDVRLAMDKDGNRYIVWAKFDILQTVPNQGSTFGYRSFITKMAPDDSKVWETSFINRRLTAVAVDASGNVTITGEDTTSPGGAGFVERFDTTGHTVWTTSINGSPSAIAVDTTGNLYITGVANPKFQATPGAFKPTPGEARCNDKNAIVPFPCSDAFVLKLSSDGKRTIYATWLGGTLNETPWNIAVGADDSAYIVGETTSDDFATTIGAAQPAFGGSVYDGLRTFGDGFIVRLDPAGQRLMYGTYLGGKGADALLALAIDPQSGNVFVAGRTEDANVMPGSRTDAMFAILSPAGTLIRKARTGNPETPEWAISASISPDGHYFSGLYLSNDVLELSPETLKPILRANLRTATAPAIFALPGGLVESRRQAAP